MSRYGPDPKTSPELGIRRNYVDGTSLSLLIDTHRDREGDSVLHVLYDRDGAYAFDGYQPKINEYLIRDGYSLDATD